MVKPVDTRMEDRMHIHNCQCVPFGFPFQNIFGFGVVVHVVPRTYPGLDLARAVWQQRKPSLTSTLGRMRQV